MSDTTTFADNMTVLRDETERITTYLADLPAASWTQPTACDAWQVQDVVAHLVGVAEFYAGNVTRGLQGDTAPPAGRPPAGSVTAAMSAEGVATRAIAERQKLGDRLLEQFRVANAHLIDVLGALNPDTQTILCYHPGGMTQARQFIDLRLKELAVHEWDIRSRLEPSASLSAACLPAIVRLIDGSVASGSLRWGFRPGEPQAEPVRYRFEVTEPVPYQSNLIVTDDAVQQEVRVDGPADVVFGCDTETFVLLVYGRLALDRALQDGRITAAGEGTRAGAFAQWFKGI
jgi:uncharacterized protein (TIGR03083 family)